MKRSLKMAFLGLLGVGLLLVNAGGTQAQVKYPVGVLVSDVKQAVVGQVFEERITLQNNGDQDLPAGTLEVTLPGELGFVSASPAPLGVAGSKISWAVPPIAVNSSAVISLVQMPQSLGSNLLTTISYSVSGTVQAQTVLQKNISAVKGAQTNGKASVPGNELPRTGSDPALLGLASLSLVWLLAKKRQSV